jgi:hypothetical protein
MKLKFVSLASAPGRQATHAPALSLMREMGLAERKKPTVPDAAGQGPASLLERNFAAPAPDCGITSATPQHPPWPSGQSSKPA